MVLIRYSNRFNCLKRKKNWIRKETYHTSNETFHQRFNFSSWKKIAESKPPSVSEFKKNLYFFLKKRNVSFENIMFLSRFPIFFNPFDNIWVFHNLPSLNSIILLLMFIFYLLRYYCQLHFFWTFFWQMLGCIQ